MPKEAVRLWESVLGQLAALSKVSSTTPADLSRQHDALLRIKALWQQLVTSETPKSAWKRIINEIKVGVLERLKLKAVQQIRCNPRMSGVRMVKWANMLVSQNHLLCHPDAVLELVCHGWCCCKVIPCKCCDMAVFVPTS